MDVDVELQRLNASTFLGRDAHVRVDPQPLDANAVAHPRRSGPVSRMASIILTTLTMGTTSWTLTMWAPCATDHATVAAVPSRRSPASTSSTAVMNDLREVPTRTG